MRGLVFILAILLTSPVFGQNSAKQLQDLSVTIAAGGSQGSGVIVTRELKLKKDEETKARFNFVITAAHVVDSVRKINEVVDPTTGSEKKVIQYGDVDIVKEFTDEGQKVGETRMRAKIVAYSDADSRHDIAVLMLYKKNFIDVSTKFYLGDEIPSPGTSILHCGSLLGQVGSNSITSGVVSQVGRILSLNGNTNNQIFDQSSAPAFPGSSGGGMFMGDGPNKNEYIGMLVRGADATFNFYTPVRRIRDYAKSKNLLWLIDDKEKAPSIEEILAAPIDDVKTISNSRPEAGKIDGKSLKFMIQSTNTSVSRMLEVANPHPIANLFDNDVIPSPPAP
jgi:S1-C subfamily serine protease